MGALSFFLGIDVKQTRDGFYLTQHRYAEDILEHARMMSCKPVAMPIDAKGKLNADGPAVDDAHSYRSLVGTLQYLTMTQPNIAFVVQQVCLHKHDPRMPHLALLKCILRYTGFSFAHR
ncbi:uncharacterized mitochondrial protein AtMg00810-like [Miscanthus floridulus]|uniref:uncharacterized mitochondrial protein AtMg00810-like n=1 Tax=Miscanthus floridulus TaxID=154761 RepID=UPI00345AF533